MPRLLTQQRRQLRRAVLCWWCLAFLMLCVLVGALAGVLWRRVVDLPGYLLAPDGSARISERGLTSLVGADSWFAGIGLLAGVGLGIVAWRWFASVGWPTVPIAGIGALVAALVCWRVGYHLAGGPFDPRLAAAQPGDFVAVELTIRAKVVVVVWVFAATIPILLRAALGRDDEEVARDRDELDS